MSDPSLNNLPIQAEKETHFLDYLNVVQRRWKIALLVFLLVFCAVAIKTFLEVPVYESSAVLRVSLKPATSQEVLEKNKDSSFSIYSEIYILQSNLVAERAAKLLQLEWAFASEQATDDIRIRRLVVPVDIAALSLQVDNNKQFRLLEPSGHALVSGQSGIPFAEGDISGLVELHKVTPGVNYPLTRLSLDEATAIVSQGVSAFPAGDEVSMIRLSVARTDPRQARDVANAIARAYQEQARDAQLKEADTILTLIDNQLVSLGRQLNISEQNLQKFRIQTGLQRLSPEGSSMVDAAVALEKQRTDLLLQQQRIKEFLANPSYSAYESSVVEVLPGVPELMSRLLELRTIRNELLRTYTSSHPDVVDVNDKIKLLRQEVMAAARLGIHNLDLEIAVVDQELAESAKRLENVPEEELELARLSRSSQVNAELYSYLLQRQQEERIAQASITSNVEIINQAQLPLSPIKPNKKKNLGMGLLLGFLLGVGLTFLLDYLDQTIKDEDDVQENLNLAVIGSIPHIEAAVSREEGQLVTHLEPHSLSAEAFLALRTNLHCIITNQKRKTIMLTSCLADEGKSTIAVNLAASMAQTGAKILLVGCDLRRPSLSVALDQAETPGLTDLLVDDRRDAVRHIEELNLDFIPAGTEPPNPTQLLGSKSMQKFIESARERYDYVFLDVPPLLPVADALVLAPLVDLNVLVMEPCRVPERLGKQAIKLLNNHEANIAGVVLNDKTGKGAKFHGAYSYYNSKYNDGYYRRVTDGPKPSFGRRFIAKVWGFING